MDENLQPTAFLSKEKGYVVLPCEMDKFEEFFIKLLGKPQTIDKSFFGDFEVKIDDIINIDALLKQRIGQQNKGNLIQTKTTIQFSDNSSVTFSTFEEFVIYNELKPVYTVGLSITWIFLIQFNDKTAPEKQEIEIAFYPTSPKAIFSNAFSWNDPLYKGVINLQIRHTARSWGTDIEFLLTNHLNTICLSNSNFFDFVTKFRSLFSGTIAFFGTLTLFKFLVNHANSRIARIKSEVTEQMKLAGDNISEKINVMGTAYADGRLMEVYYSLQIQLLIGIGIIFCLFSITMYLATINQHSYLIFTKESIINSQKGIANYFTKK